MTIRHFSIRSFIKNSPGSDCHVHCCEDVDHGIKDRGVATAVALVMVCKSPEFYFCTDVLS